MSDYLDEVFGAGGLLAARFPGYQPRPGQVALARAVDLAISSGTHLLAEAATGCHAAGQGILMFDGTIKRVEDVQVGDQLMGPDSEPRTVLGLARGEQEMVDVVPIKGEPWRVNLDHMLTLVRTNEGCTGRKGRFDGNIVDARVRDVLNWSKTQRHLHKLFRAAANFGTWPQRFVISPYFMGVILGDGALAHPSTGMGITTADPEIVREIEKAAAEHVLHVRHDGKFGYHLAGVVGAKKHPLLVELRRLGLSPIACAQRFIPHIYKTASRTERLELLAGLIDTDGSLDLSSGTCFDYISKSPTLANDVAFVARSLGFAAYVKLSKKRSQTMTAQGDYFRVCISGDTDSVPCRIPRKRAPAREQIKDVRRTGFDLVPTGKVEPYFGFTLDRDGRFLLDDFTVTHNTGKSIAYAVPAIYHALKNDMASVIVTANIALQEQLVKKDLPLLDEILPESFTFALLKGKSNYLCLEKLEKGARGKLDPADIEMNDKIDDWARSTRSGDISELPFEPPSRLWSRFSVSADECSGKECEFYKECHSEKARQAARVADVVVTNYHLLFADMKVVQMTGGLVSLLPPHHAVVLDEGHKAVDIARDFFGFRITEGSMRWAGARLPPKQLMELEDAQLAFFSSLLVHKRSGAYKARLRRSRFIVSEPLDKALANAAAWYGDTLREIPDDTVQDRKYAKEIASRFNRAHELRAQIREAMNLSPPPKAPWKLHPEAVQGDTPETRWFWSDPALGGDNTVKCEAALASTESVYFIEEENGRAVLSSKPIRVDDRLRKQLFDSSGSVSVTSATLAVKNSFEFVASDLGVPKPTTLIAQSPFTWMEQCLLVLPTDIPEPNDPTFTLLAAERCAETIEAACGRTLGLFTSYKGLNAAHERALKTGYRILRQGDMPRTRLIDEFRRDVNSVLLGTESFWAGVDVPGESLSCVFIDKLPFTTPEDPVMDALTERDKNWFMKYSVPRAIIAFKQGFGRLIRTTTDRGAVVVLDKRLTTKFYGGQFIYSLPLVQRSNNIDDVRRFLDRQPIVGYAPPRSLTDRVAI